MTAVVRPGSRRLDVLLHLAIGAVSVGVDLGVLALLVEGLRVPLALSTALAFGTSVAVNFSLNRLLVAGPGAGRLGRHATRYLVLLVANLLVTLLVVLLADAAAIPYLAAKVVVVLASAGWNFVLYRRWVFADGRAHDRSTEVD